eukprot:gene8080-8911_t
MQSYALKFILVGDCRVGAALVFDICRKESFDNLKTRWMTQIREHGHEGMRLILVGNKVDLVQDCPEKREVSLDEAMTFAEDEKMDYIETSALTGHCVETMFRRLILSTAKLLPDIKMHLELAALPEGWMIFLPPEPQSPSSAVRRTSIRQIDISSLDINAAESNNTIDRKEETVEQQRPSRRLSHRIPSGNATTMTVTINNIHTVAAEQQQQPTNSVSEDGRTSQEGSESVGAQSFPGSQTASIPSTSSPSISARPRLMFMNYWTGDIHEETPKGPADPELIYIAGTARKLLDSRRCTSTDDRTLTERSSSVRTLGIKSGDADEPKVRPKKSSRRCLCAIL